MHIAYFTNTYLPVVSGVVRSVQSFRDALSALGHNVFIFAQEDDYEDTEPFIFRYPSLKLPLPGDIPTALPVSSFVDQLLPKLKLDIIHTHHPFLLGQTAAGKARDLNLPLVFTFHTQYHEYTHYVPIPQEQVQEFLKDRVMNWLREYMRKCQHIVVPSESMRSILVNDYGLVDRFTVIPTGLDIAPYKDADGNALRAEWGWPDDKVIISVGRLAEEKNWATLLQAFAHARKEQPNIRLVLVGDGPQAQALQQLAGELGITERVLFAGRVPFEQVPTYLKAADLFAFASVTETQGLATLEAMAAGLPVVAVAASGTQDIVEDGTQGLLVQNDPNDLANGIVRLVEKPSLMSRFRSAALRKSRSYDNKRLARKMLKVYEQAIQDKKDGQFVTVQDKAALVNAQQAVA
ncbi:MAG: glycosyltransferase family 4 protein [Syntrophothermus sp.]